MTAEGAAADNLPGAGLPATPLEDWSPRPWLLAGLGALAALFVHLLVDDFDPDAARSAGAAFFVFGSLSFALTLGPGRLRDSALFSGGLGIVMAGLAWHWVRAKDSAAGEEFAFAAAVFASAIAVPLFQADFHRTRFATSYRLTHFHVWTDAITGAGAIAFTGLSWLLLVLLDQLLQLVGITAIDWLFDQEWFGWVWTGGAFGAALGVLRNNLKVIGSLQHVVLLVLSLLAVPLALALLVFLVALLASGGQALWNATDAATPVLLACAVGCFVLANAIVRDGEDAISGNTVMRLTAIILAAGVLPLAVFAAVSMGLRIGQHGLTPERIWAIIAVGVAVAYGLAYVAGMIRGKRAGWAGQVRQANLYLAAGTCVLALLLALPLVDFGAISARSQVARLDAGEVSPDDFDYTALRWDFGDAGRRALDRLAQRDGLVGEKATLAKAQTSRPYDWDRDLAQDGFTGTVRVQPANPALQARVEALLNAEPWRCSVYCVALDLGAQADGGRQIALVQGYGYEQLTLPADPASPAAPPAPEVAPAAVPLNEQSRVEVREETVRYIYIDGKKLGQPLP
ncbi:DUF4153 domain-containing protein [Alteraurantiacibacter buctensis]|uniref:DUF4153 domain-containing protein n=1 Tax=Alteraurantiacibacter buctensis TaxID=1503981 RepID=A0A844Z0D4_9SPHN|nr:DUF4153 domain-containing protein [Alteraurantiacibacter buctensis]MXO72716.1 DUF4153 domain-containing protein [Alteraurantiacibacter buctensis]